MILIEECLRNFETLASLRMEHSMDSFAFYGFPNIETSTNTLELSDLFVDISSAIERIEFTNVERKVLAYIMKGHNYSEVAKVVGINRLTVPDHFATICHKIVLELNGDYETKLTEK